MNERQRSCVVTRLPDQRPAALVGLLAIWLQVRACARLEAQAVWSHSIDTRNQRPLDQGTATSWIIISLSRAPCIGTYTIRQPIRSISEAGERWVSPAVRLVQTGIAFRKPERELAVRPIVGHGTRWFEAHLSAQFLGWCAVRHSRPPIGSGCCWPGTTGSAPNQSPNGHSNDDGSRRRRGRRARPGLLQRTQIPRNGKDQLEFSRPSYAGTQVRVHATVLRP